MIKRKDQGFTLILGIISLLLIIPVLGLAIDVGFLYAVKTKLQAGVDGASLAAARALNLGQTTTQQAVSAQNNAVNWFYANFPVGYFGTTGTVMGTANVNVFNDPVNPLVRNVTVVATTQVPTLFMKWLGFNLSTVSSAGNASRRDVVAMMVLDRSGSMNSVAGACASLIAAGKLFTGQFSAGRDKVGLISFAENYYLHSSPTTNFQTTLGYTNGSGSGTGQLDTITCQGGTNTAQAVAVAYNELYKLNLPGALNVIMFETDGLPNTLTMNFWDSTAGSAGIASGSNCTDLNGKKKSQSGFGSLASLPNWTAGHAFGSTLFPDIPKGMVGAIASDDPLPTGKGLFFTLNYYTASTGNNFNTDSWLDNSTAPGCAFDGGSYVTSFPPPDIAWFPLTDVFGNMLNPPYTFLPVTVTSGHVAASSYTNFHNAALNATDHSAYRARTNGTNPAYFFGVGLGGTAASPPDYVLMQRMANDPRGDEFNSPPLYQACANEPNCSTDVTQPQGNFIFSSDSSKLGLAFLAVSSQVLRLSK
jgi:Flp pilus assembly protein TadG